MINGKKLIEIRKAGFVNKGAELMLYAILDKMKKEFPDAEFTMETAYRAAPYKKRAELGFYQKAQFWYRGFQFGRLFSLVPKQIRDVFGIVLDKELDIVIDAAGFAYGDQWETTKTETLAELFKRCKRHGSKTILMPQAFGPFTSKRIKKAITVIADNADIIFAREQKSYDYLINAVGKRENIMLYPDFTNLVEGVVPDYFDSKVHGICIVPNKQMVVMAKIKHEVYIEYLAQVINFYIENGCNPFILIHEESADKIITEDVLRILNTKIPVVNESNPIAIKGILGASYATIGSRFHGLAGALSQGVPSLAMGWSHKYEELFNDYGYPKGIVDFNCSNDELKEKLSMVIEKKTREDIISTLNIESKKLKKKSEEMWVEVFRVCK